MPKTQNQKYLMKVDLGGGQYRYLYTQEEVAAYKAGKTGGGNQSHGESHYQYQTTDRTSRNGVTTGRNTNVRNANGSISRTTDRKTYAVKAHQLNSAPASRTGGGNASQQHYQYQRSKNGKTTVYSGTGAAQRTISRDPVARRKAAEQLANAPKNSGGVSSSRNYRYMAPTSKTTTTIINPDKNGKKKSIDGRIDRTWSRVRNGKGTYEGPEINTKSTYTPISKRAKVEDAVEKGKAKAKKAIKEAPGKAKSTAKKVAKGYDNATTKIADKALKATPKIKKTAKNIAKNYDNATTKIADKAVKATPKAKKAIKSAAKNYDNATTKMANAAWNATHSKAAQNAKKTVSSGAKKASNALTKAWNNLFKKKKK
jgi:hypothetical protein